MNPQGALIGHRDCKRIVRFIIASATALALASCVDSAPTKATAREAAPFVSLTNFLSGPGTWQWKVNHINGSYVWYIFATYADGTTDRLDVVSGSMGALRPLDPLKSVHLDAVWCFKPIGEDHNLCGTAIVDQIGGVYQDQVVGWDPVNPYYIGPGDDFIVEFILPSSCPASAACAPTLTVTSDHPKYIIGETAQFHATLSNGAAPVVTGWSWNSTPAAGCTKDAICDFAVSGNGTMTVTAVFSGHTLTASVAVIANTLDCPTGDSLLDDPTVRRALVAAVALGHGLDKDFSKWKEYDAVLLETPIGRISQPLALKAGADACHSNFDSPSTADSSLLGDVLRAIIHVHPGYEGKDGHCPSKSGTLQPYASGPDEIAMKKMWADNKYKKAGWPASWLIIDNEYVFIYTPDAKGNPHNNWFPWNAKGCNWDQF